MPAGTLERLRAALGCYVEPYLGMTLEQAGAVLDVEAGPRGPLVTLELGFPVGGYVETLSRALDAHLAAAGVAAPAGYEVRARIPALVAVSRRGGLQEIANVVAVASGKGGVGKSTVAANLALALAAQGARAGILDADIYGPSMPRMMGLAGERPTTTDGRTLDPPRGHGLPVMSIGFLIDTDQPMAWRGPMVTQALTQMLADTRWGALDYLVVDMPPGTGDIQLTLTQRVPVSGAVIVTTPQELALADARKGLQMFRKVGVPVLGIVENMGVHRCPACAHESYVFDSGGGEALAARYGTKLLGQLPLEAAIREQADSGRPTVVADPDGTIAAIYKEIARKTAVFVAQKAEDFTAKFPSIVIQNT
jgi:ATP-binding protein involved in chromosome partitioning